MCDPSLRDSFIVDLVGPQGFLWMCQRCGTIQVGSVMSTEYLPKIGVKDWIYAWIIYKLTAAMKLKDAYSLEEKV